MINKLSTTVVSAFVTFSILMMYVYSSGWSILISRSRPTSITIPATENISTPQSPAPPPFDFVPPAYKNFYDCDDLFSPDTSAAGFQMSSEFNASFSAFEAAVRKFKAGQHVSGHTGRLPSLYKTIHYLASRPNVHNVCETGFYLGYSAFNYLTANSHAIVHSFDMGVFKFTFKVAEYLRQRFPSRLFLHFGNSIKSLPEFVRKHPDHRCDFILVDGGHDYKSAMADIRNMATMANMVTGNVVVFDDYPCLVPLAPTGWAWENMRRWGYVRELLRCSFKKNRQYPNRGFVVGTIVRRPPLSD